MTDIAASRVAEIIDHERQADQLAAASDAHRWEAARLIAEELDGGKSQRQLAADIGKSQTHVSFMARAWRDYQGNQLRPPFAEAYQALKAKPVPAAIEAPTSAIVETPAPDESQEPQPLTPRTPERILRQFLFADFWACFDNGADQALLAEARQFVDEQEAEIAAARRYLRHGVTEMPPATWKPVTGGSTPAQARNALARERNRLGEWEIRVARQVGLFVKWCEGAGIRFEGKSRVSIVLPERLTYPALSASDEKLTQEMRESGEWGPDDEHAAAYGHFCAWFYEREELAEMVA